MLWSGKLRGSKGLGQGVEALTAKGSKKDDLQRELERLRQAKLQERNRSAVLESETRQLKRENLRLTERSAFIEQLSERVRSAHEKLEILHSLIKELASFDLDGVLEVCVQRIPYLVGARYASVYLYDAQARQLVLKQHNHGHEINGTVNLDEAPNSLMATAVRTRQLLCIDDLGGFETEEGERPARPHQDKYQTNSCVVAPLVAAGEVEGVLNLADRFDQRPFDSDEQSKMIQQACELVAVALHNARLFEVVQRAARTDSLTGLLNHQAFAARLETEVKRSRRYEGKLAVLAVKVHGVGLLNANYGHQAGDQVIRVAATLLGGNVRDVDETGRTGGASFGIILPEQEQSGALVVARRLTGILSERSVSIGEVECQVEATCGVAEATPELSGAELFQVALRNLERARAAGERIGVDP